MWDATVVIVRFIIGLALIGGGGWIMWDAAQAAGPLSENLNVEMVGGGVLVLLGICCWGMIELLAAVLDDI